jgi:hypothetical protein
MTLQELNNEIHIIRTPDEMAFRLDTLKTYIRNILILGYIHDQEYFRNHTGRELIRKLYYFGMESEIPAITSSYDSGFRPLSIDEAKQSPSGEGVEEVAVFREC